MKSLSTKHEIHDKVGIKHVLTFNEETKSILGGRYRRNDFDVIMEPPFIKICQFKIRYPENIAKIDDLSIPMTKRRRGIGTEVVSILEGELRERGVAKITGNTSPIDGEGAPLFWVKMGYSLSEDGAGGHLIEKSLFP